MNPGGLNNSGIAVTSLRPGDVGSLAEAALVQGMADVCREIERLQALRVAMAAEVDARAVSFDTLGFRSVKQWLAANSLLEVPAAARILALGRMLSRQPEIADAFNSGGISAEHASLIGKFCETPPRGMPNEALGSCRKVAGRRIRSRRDHHDRSHLHLAARADLRIRRTPTSEDTERNEFHASKTLNGRVAVKGDLDAVTGEMLLTALSALTKPRNPVDDPAGGGRRRDSEPMPSPKSCAATSTPATPHRGRRAAPPVTTRERRRPRPQRSSARVGESRRRVGPVRRQRHRTHAPHGDHCPSPPRDGSRATATSPHRRGRRRTHQPRPQQPDCVEETAPRLDRPRPRLRLPRLRHTTRPLRRPPRKALGRRRTTDLDNLVLLCRYHHTCCTTPTGKWKSASTESRGSHHHPPWPPTRNPSPPTTGRDHTPHDAAADPLGKGCRPKRAGQARDEARRDPRRSRLGERRQPQADRHPKALGARRRSAGEHRPRPVHGVEQQPLQQDDQVVRRRVRIACTERLQQPVAFSTEKRQPASGGRSSSSSAASTARA